MIYLSYGHLILNYNVRASAFSPPHLIFFVTKWKSLPLLRYLLLQVFTREFYNPDLEGTLALKSS